MQAARLLKKKAYDQFASKERKFVAFSDPNKKNCKSNRIIMCIGAAGTGIGSRIRGHAKRGGKQLQKRHRRYVTVAITNEHNSSQTCSTCFHPIAHPEHKIKVNGKMRSKTNNGVSICYNPLCPTYKNGTNSKNRDVEAAACIAIAGMTTMIYGHPLPPFAVNTSQSKTGELYNRAPPVTGAMLVPG